MKLQLTSEMKAAMPLIEKLESDGYEAVFVGGAVRDAVLGLAVHDIDIATSALPEQVMGLFPKCIPTGLQHGTVTVVQQGETYEVTTYRTESSYEQFRKPSSVAFVLQLDEDLLRRDFTMNAMAIRQSGYVYDPYNGQHDLRESRLRCVGKANDRLQEDALRMLRAIRFLGTYRLRPVPSLWRGLKSYKGLLRHIAMERVQAELDKMLSGDAPERGLAWLGASGLWGEFKEPASPALLTRIQQSAEYDGVEMASLSSLEHLDERWAAILLSLRAAEKDAQELLVSLRLPNKRAGLVMTILRLHTEMAVRVNEDDESRIRAAWLEAVIRYGEEAAGHWLHVVQALKPQRGQLSQEIVNRLYSIMKEMPAKSLKQLAIGGNELQQALSRRAGPWMSRLLNRLLIAVASGDIVNEKGKLIEQSIIWNEEGTYEKP
ncbi:CCA tRNA nucleotidyltransferase [Paenibacillus paeoniae]|uniref:CCA tRNA nucleotidyltransferase n=1 Tax=Paenibacillus paeoniae TaxID=2292705 RepID=A0A371PM17_9BACL|nr:CCA tRNA nucleotidyltransferase [Paenibacillus paeoniae]REK77221.1 CCA tRNA nucleotidyltransferase [Paenibacillus paeoniae]